ncbi:GNAT family N-acetyltransferase [Fulvivirga sp.]|uniref:GNAT family N-acetyltransferase n=1 Tax=Fulvivirga sp. TaxID=1931237 RepID=UPI0032EAFA59
MIELIDQNFELHATQIPGATPSMTIMNSENVVAVDSGLSCDTFNIIFIKNGLAITQAELDDTIKHYRNKDFDFCIWVNADNLTDNLKEIFKSVNVSHQNEEVGMVLDLSQYEAIHSDRHNDIVLVQDVKTLNDYANVIAANWSPPDRNVNSYYEKTTNSYLENSKGVMLFVYYDGQQPLATVELFPSDDSTIGIYGLATLEDARGKGIGSALMTKCLNISKTLGYKNVVLQASEAGIGIYKKLGFESFTTYHEYA